jgi:hydroxyethylthiazole kinase-like uncharacterized protein yjeF
MYMRRRSRETDDEFALIHARVSRLDEEALRAWPLPMPCGDGDKEERGQALIIAGSQQMPGTAILAAIGALRAGAGKVTIATNERMAPFVAAAVPEARVIGLRENAAGGFGAATARTLAQAATKQDATLIGPGMVDESSVHDFVRAMLPRLQGSKVVLDAYAMGIVNMTSFPFTERAHRNVVDDGADGTDASPFLLTPHAGEMAHLSGADKASVTDDPMTTAADAAARWKAVVALKGAITHIAAADGRMWRHEGGSMGLGVSGSGDALAGIIVGLAARGATLEQAAAWGVLMHARAGARLESRFGPLGYRAAEIVDEIPALMHGLRADR